MPKDWATHKAEVERLYIEEGRTLNEVRNILRRRHGFDASTRAYRMRFETWEIRKNKRKERSSHENSPDLATNSGTATGPDLKISLPPASKIDEAFVQYGPFMIPQRPMNADDVLSLMKGPSAGFYALEILLRKWQPGGEYLDILTTYLQTVKDFEGIIRNSDEGGPLLFKLIEERVPSEEQFDVGKLLLETHFLSRHKPQPHDSPWLLVWIAATRTTEWEDAKEILYEGNRVACLAGNLFLDCALIVIAEQMLKRYIKQFRAFKVHNGRLSRSMLADADWCRRKYLHIFKDSNCLRDMPLRPLFYRYSLEIIETQVEITDCPHDVDCIELANDCRQKYLKLTSSPMDTHAISDAVDDLLRDVEESDWIEDSTSNTPAFGPMMLSSEPQSAVTNTSQSFSAAESSQNHYLDDHQWISDRLGENNMPGRDPRVSSSRNIIEVLIRRWKSLKGFNSYVHSLLLNDGSDISIFDPHDNNNNLFDLIRTQTPQTGGSRSSLQHPGHNFKQGSILRKYSYTSGE
ncbi:hypothetical protein G7Y89_g8652 [Cudoniella acicularis]|uniref:Clr5 domain-containing protein n=1 Tax=Cudoniella acicularis TaxID=354080 RepID=A0A8H4RIS1_9HELO|nr:hypothetical protein G7Y89_g8652 [Cudoniella acicularis]